MFEQDYVMRLIKEMVRAILKLLFHIDTESPTVELLENKEENDFSRDEIKLGLENVSDSFGLSRIAKMFLTDF